MYILEKTAILFFAKTENTLLLIDCYKNINDRTQVILHHPNLNREPLQTNGVEDCSHLPIGQRRQLENSIPPRYWGGVEFHSSHPNLNREPLQTNGVEVSSRLPGNGEEKDSFGHVRGDHQRRRLGNSIPPRYWGGVEFHPYSCDPTQDKLRTVVFVFVALFKLYSLFYFSTNSLTNMIERQSSLDALMSLQARNSTMPVSKNRLYRGAEKRSQSPSDGGSGSSQEKKK